MKTIEAPPDLPFADEWLILRAATVFQSVASPYPTQFPVMFRPAQCQIGISLITEGNSEGPSRLYDIAVRRHTAQAANSVC